MTSSQSAGTTFRLGRLVLGVAIVVGVLLVGGFFVLGRVTDFPLDPAVRSSRTCTPDSPQATLTPEALRSALVPVWIMGVRAGSHAGSTLALRNKPSFDDGEAQAWQDLSASADQAAAAVARMAERLKISPPAPFVAERLTAGIAEFIGFVESNSHETALTLTRNYAPQACQVYKLGLYWGFSTLFRASDPGARNGVAPEIAYHATQLGVPADLQSLMMDPSRSAGPVKAVLAESEEISRKVAEYWLKY